MVGYAFALGTAEDFFTEHVSDADARSTGGLMSYGASLSDTYRQVGVYAGKVLRGAKPDDLPVLRPTRFEMVINMKTAKTLGLAVPPPILIASDELIE
jgi:putative ABC transport system substrate-binding protein